MAREGIEVEDERSLRLRRAAAQLLHRPPARPPGELARALLAVQAQDLRGARLALRARTTGLTAALVDAALDADGDLVVTWLMRGTLHLVHRDDHPWLLALTAPTRLAANRRRLGQEGVDADRAERAVAVVHDALAAEGPLTRPELAERLAARNLPAAGQAVPHLLALAALRGVVVLGPVRGDHQAFALARDWLGRPAPEPAGRDAALAELARRYLAAHGPAADADLAAWAGLPLRDARAGLERIAPSLTRSPAGLLDLAHGRDAPTSPAPRLVPALDPYLLGWKDRSPVVPPAYARRVHPGGGVIRAVAVADAAAVGTWSSRRRDGRLAVEIAPFEPLETEVAEALDDDAVDVARFEGLAAG